MEKEIEKIRITHRQVGASNPANATAKADGIS